MNAPEIPAYCYFDEVKFSQYLSGFGLNNTDSQLAFFHCCSLVRDQGGGALNVSDLLTTLKIWAERENVPQFRNPDTAKQSLYTLLYSLREYFLAELETTGQEIDKVIFRESEYFQVYNFFQSYNFNQAKSGFIDVNDLYSVNSASFIDRIKIENLDLSEIEFEKRGARLVQLEFPHNAGTLLFPGDQWSMLEKVARHQVSKLLYSRYFTRDLDQIIRKMRSKPGLEFTTESVIQECVENNTENSAIFFEELFDGLTNYLITRKDFSNQEELIKSILILEKGQQHKVYQTEVKLKEKNLSHDKEQLLRFLRRKRSFFTLNDIHHIIDEADFKASLSREYSAIDWDRLVEEFIEEYVQNNESNSEQGLFKLEVNDGLSYMFLDYYIENVVHLREEFEPRAKKFLYNNWLAQRSNGEKVFEYTSPSAREKSLNSWVQGSAPKLSLLLSDSAHLQRSILSISDPTKRKALFDTFWDTKEQKRHKWEIVFALNVEELISEVEAAVPISSRFWLLRIFKLILAYLKGERKSSEEKKPGSSASSTASGQEKPIILQKTELLKSINQLQVGLLKNKKYERGLRELIDEWNIKLGPVREDFLTEVNDFVRKGCRNRFNMLRSLRGNQIQFALTEIENLSHETYAKFQTEIRSEKKFLDYVRLYASGILRTLIQKQP